MSRLATGVNVPGEWGFKNRKDGSYKRNSAVVKFGSRIHQWDKVLEYGGSLNRWNTAVALSGAISGRV